MAAVILFTIAAVLVHSGSCQWTTEKSYSYLSFTHHLYNATIHENSAPKTYVESPVKMGIQVTDLLWDIKYKLVAGDDDALFRTEAYTVGDFCFLRISTRGGNSASLNREVRESYTLTIEATESTHEYQARTKVSVRVLDMNDLKPLFYPASYYVNLREDTPLRSSVARVSATDADVGSNANFYYSFTDRAHPFAVDPFTGTVTLIKKLEHSRVQRYDLTILAEDRNKKISGTRKFGNTARVVISIDKVSPKPPRIKPQTTIAEVDKISVIIAVEDVEKGLESLSVVAGDPLRNFEIIPFNLEGHTFQVVSTKRINWLKSPFGMNLSLQAKDRSNPPLISHITDIHIPSTENTSLKFEKEIYHATLSEFAPPKSNVVRVSVKPNGSNVTFQIKNNPDSSKFYINPKSGIVVTTQSMDFAKKSQFEFIVMANQGEAETRVVVDITDENDNAPTFTYSSYQGTLPENIPIGSSVLTVTATDRDTGKNGLVTYAIANAGPVPFTVDPFSGVISTSEELDYELMQRWFHLRVWASDSGLPFSHVSECSVTLVMSNVNDNVPLFERVGCNATIPHDLGVGESVGAVSALDLDELEHIRYRIESDEYGLFEVDPVSGTIILAKRIPPFLLVSQMPTLNFSITATDGKYNAIPTSVRVTLTKSGSTARMHCHETGVLEQLTERLIKSIKPETSVQEEDTFSEVHIINRHSPKFDTSLPSSIDIREDFKLNSTILHFKATDDDTGFNSMLVYVISSGNEDGCFTIEMDSGDLKIICRLDRETKGFYILNITVYDLGTPQKSVWKFLAVNILDANDNPPIFDQPRYVITIPENTEVDKSIFEVHATDIDLDDNGNIRYSLQSSSETFKINEQTGVVRVTGRLDRETCQRHDLKIEARDQAKKDPQLFTTTDLVVVLQDINDNPPKFVPKLYKIQIPEDVPMGTVLLWVESYDFDLGSGRDISYNLKNTENGMFFLDSFTGSLTLEKELDFEKKHLYNLTVRAVDHGLPRSLSSSCFVEVEVSDVNENLNPPVFSRFVYETKVREDAAVGTSVLTLTAEDQDYGRDGVVRFHILDGSGLGVFTVDAETGVIRTAVSLDRETMIHYWLTISATDLGTIPLISWTEVYVEVLDINDNPPEPSQPAYFGSVLENLPGNTFVLQVKATDADSSSEGQLTFQIQETQRTYFTINPQTGAISTLVTLDREQKAEHILEVTVSDNGSPALRSTATVVVQVLDVNDNSPKFSHVRFEVALPERRGVTEPQVVYRMVARDDDEGTNAEVTYRLLDSLDQKFDIHPTTGVVSSKSDFEHGDYNILSIKATDHGVPAKSSEARLYIQWLPSPEPTPETLAFDEPHFTFAVMETDPVTHMVGIISTEITPNPIWFDIVGGEGAQDFDIEKTSGSMMVARPLDAGKKSNYNLTVRVTDGSQVINTQAYIRVVDMNEHRPVFLNTRYEVVVPEDTARWAGILQISARDEDSNSKLVFSIYSSAHPNSLNHFHLDPRSGTLMVTEELDFETIPVHTLVVMVRDQEIPVKRNFVRVTVNVEDCNDHSPAFLSPNYEGSVLNLAVIGTEVLQVKALDQDEGSNAEIVYSIHSGNIEDAFSIDPQTGSLTVAKPLENLPQELYHLNVKATDQGFPQHSDICSVNIRVKLSENTQPKFSSAEYFTEIHESSPSGSPLLTVEAYSPSAVRYSIKEGDPNGTFHINHFSGVLSTQAALNFEECFSYRLQITATSTAGVSSDTFIYVYVVDDNDNPPVFLQDEFVGQISESAPVNSMVMGESNVPLVVRATDEDTGSNSQLVFQILEPEVQKVFRVESSMGTISIISTVDFESTPEFRFSIQVWDSGLPSLYAAKPAKVIVRILDYNDCPPKFSAPLYESSILFPVVQGMEAIRVTASDLDSDVSYAIYEGNVHSTFRIDPSTGVVSVNNVSSLKPNQQLFVKASDGLYKDTAIVKINVTNSTKTGLEFEQKFYAATVMENITFVETLAVLRASGSYLNEPLIYSVLNPQGMFSVVSTSGVLETTGVPFDREEKDEYDVVVEVRDIRSPPRIAVTQVKVYIGDSNDNTPEFLNSPYFVTISDDADPGDVLFQVTAIDKDLGENGSVTYLLEDDFGLFRIDPYLGDLSLQRPLDFESMNKYVLSVLARDEGEPSLTSVAELQIQVRNRSNPIFQSPLYRLKVPENISPFTTILHVQARNPEGYRLIYNLVEENASRNFHMDFKTGVLSVTDLLDYETQTRHILTIRATDSVTGSFSEATVEIEIEDVNDNAPEFPRMTYTAHISEGLPVGTSVFQISATDKDTGRNKELIFEIMGMEKNDTDFFEINPVSGLIVTTQTLDFEAFQQYQLKIIATDKGAPPMSSEAFVIINVTDINDNPPNFSQSQYQATLNNMATCGHIVIKIQASDPDSRDSDNLEYKIISGNEDRNFAINKSSGLISFSNVCKRSLDPFYNLTVAVSDGIFQNTAPVNIDMTNTNKHSPYFDHSIYEAELAENSEAGTRVIRLAAIDLDDGPYGTIDYTIINKLADDKFSINNEGQIITSQPLDRENPTQRVIAIKVMAKDGGGKVAFCTVKIILTDENDNPPQFQSSEYQVSIQSNVNKGSPIIQIMAYDADDGKNADVTYTVDEAEEVTEDVIEINPFTGIVSIKESLVGLENKIFNFKVKARDGGIPFFNSTTPVQVKVVPPEVPLPRFSEPLYTFSASEDLPMGSEIGTVKADAEMPVIYSLVEGNTVESNRERVFTIDKESGTLLVQKDIDHEKTKWYQIDVMAHCNHNGTDVASLVSVSIQVQDVNDNQPVFEANPYRAFLAENMPPGTTVIQVTANDPDTETSGKVTYRVEPEQDDVSEVFVIDSESGWITTLKEMDREATSLYRFHVVATDHGGKVKLSSSVLVEVTVTDENDNPPQFTEEVYQGSVMENSRPGEVVATVIITDADVSGENRQITCYITDGDPHGQFGIVRVGEHWKVALKGPLDREVKDKYNLKITATDGQFQASASVEVHVLDINDNSPMCEQLLYTEVVMENSPSGMFILKVSATDPDAGSNGQVTFTLHGPNAEKFHLNPQTGELFTLAVLDREQDVEYDLVAKASDGGGRSCQADILLMIQDMNDNAPRFSNSHYAVTIFDNTTARTPIAVIYAKDPDTGINSEVVYSLLGSDSSYFSLDEFSGILRLERSLADETRSTFEVKVQATDRGLPRRMHSVATVTVNVLDLDSYQPVFSSSEYSAQIPESTAIGTQVLSVSAHSKDNGVPIVYHVISGNEHGMFELDSETGSLFVNRSLDFERCHEYYLSVEGTRGRSTFSDIAMVVVNVTDVNDNPPTFRQGDYSVEVPEDISPGDSVMQVIADDIDGPPNNLVHYSIVSGDTQRQFSIDPHSGEIRVSRRLDREEVTYYSLTVLAADRGDPPLSTAVQVTVTVSDINDNPPAFSQISHSLVLQEGDPLGVGVLQLIVSDRDLPQNGPPFSYHIVSGNEERRFHIDQGGLLSTTAALRKGTKAQYLLKIQVTDSGHPPLSSICVVRINVTEQSRHPPSAVPLDIFITTVDKPVWHRVIGKLHATDQDIHDALSYELVSELPAGGRFSVDRVDGKVVAERPLESGLYTLNVSVSDGRFSAWPRVQVHVWGADQRALDHGVTLQLAGMSPEEFVGDHWRGLQRSLGAGLGVPWQELHVASLQRDPGSLGLEVLLVWRRQGGAAVALPPGRLDAVISETRDATGLEVLRVHHGPCVGTDCPARGCRNTVHLTEERVTQYATARASFITPQHTWESICSCNESAVHFDGSGYLKYLYQDQEKPTFRLSLRVKTSQKHTVLVTANSTDWGSLEVVEGQLQFRYSCRGSPQGTLAVPTGLVSSGSWHHVLLEADEELMRLALDGVHAASIALSKPCRLARPGGSLLFAAPHFLGCLDNVEFNGEAMTGAERPAGLAFGERRVFGIYQCCQQALGCASDPCQNGGTCEPDSNGEIHCTCPPQFSGPHCENSPCDNAPCDCNQPISERMCQNHSDCPSCENLHKAPESLGLIEIVEISLAVVGLVILVSVFVGIRKCYVQRKKHKTADARDSSGFLQSNVAKGMIADSHKGLTIEMTTVGDRRRNDLDHDPFRSLKTWSELGSMEAARAQKPSGPVVCSVAPNLPPPPPSSSDNESIVKNNWELDYDVYPADPDYYGRPTVQEFPQFDIVEDTYRPAPAVDPRRISRFGGFPFPLDRSDRRAPLPPCYSNQNLDDFLGSDGLPLPSSQCPNEYTAISYYPSQHTQSLDNVSGGGYQRLSLHLSVAQPSYADCSEALPEADRTPPTPHSYEGSDTVESDYGSGEEVLF